MKDSALNSIFVKVGSTVLTALVLFFMGIDSSGKLIVYPTSKNQEVPIYKLLFRWMANDPLVEENSNAPLDATLAAWEEMQLIDGEMHVDISLDDYSDLKAVASRYRSIDLSEADPLMANLIRDAINMYEDAHWELDQISGKYQQNVTQLTYAAMYPWQKNNVKMQLDVKLQQDVDKVVKKLMTLNQRDKSVARQLSKKYSVEFWDQH